MVCISAYRTILATVLLGAKRKANNNPTSQFSHTKLLLARKRSHYLAKTRNDLAHTMEGNVTNTWHKHALTKKCHCQDPRGKKFTTSQQLSARRITFTTLDGLRSAFDKFFECLKKIRAPLDKRTVSRSSLRVRAWKTKRGNGWKMPPSITERLPIHPKDCLQFFIEFHSNESLRHQFCLDFENYG